MSKRDKVWDFKNPHKYNFDNMVYESRVRCPEHKFMWSQGRRIDVRQAHNGTSVICPVMVKFNEISEKKGTRKFSEKACFCDFEQVRKFIPTGVQCHTHDRTRCRVLENPSLLMAISDALRFGNGELEPYWGKAVKAIFAIYRKVSWVEP